MNELENDYRTAMLWRAGKMIGGDEDAVRDTLLSVVQAVMECGCSHCLWLKERAAAISSSHLNGADHA